MDTNYIGQILIKELRSGSNRWIEYRPRSFFFPHSFVCYPDQDVCGATLADSRSDLLRAEIYPDSDDTGTGVPPVLSDGPDEVYDRIEHHYNRQGERTETKDQNETVRAFDYDKLGRQIHDRVVTVGSSVDGAVRRISSTYDVRGSIAGVATYDDPATGSSNVVNELVFEYNDLGMPVTEYQEHQGTKHGNTLYVQYDYDTTASGGVFTRGLRPTSVRYPNGRRIHLDYGPGGEMADALGRVAAIRDDDGGSPGDTLAEYAYLGLGRIVTEDYVQPQVKLNYDTGTPGDYAGFDRFGRVIDHLWYAYGASADRNRYTYGYDRDRYTYGYDRASNRLYRENTLTTGRDELYGYDQVDRLIAFQRGELNATKDGIIGTPVKAEEWGLDTTGNWDAFLQKTSGTTELEQARMHNPVNEITAITATTGTDWADPVHDRNGNMTTIPKPANLADGLTATYDAWKRLVEVKDGQTVIARYEYDGLNRRIKSHIDSGAPSNPSGIDTYVHYYHNSAWQILETRRSDTPSAQPETLQPKHQYVWSQRYIDAAVLRDENTGANGLCDDQRLYYLNDANFNVTALLDTAGDPVERYLYSPYGVVTIYDATWSNTRTASSHDVECTYTGRELAAETGLYHYRHRVYQAMLGRFVTRDLLGYGGGGLHLYQYVSAEPSVSTDPFGQLQFKDCTDKDQAVVKYMKDAVKRILSSRNNCWPTDEPCSCRGQLKDCLLATLDSDLSFECITGRTETGNVAGFGGQCQRSKNRDNTTCQACTAEELKGSRIQYPRQILHSRDLAYRDGLFLHELLHACVGSHDDKFGRPDARNLAMEFMIACGHGWRAGLGGRYWQVLPPMYKPVIIRKF